MKRAYKVGEGAYFVPTYFDTTIVQSFDARTVVELSGPSIEHDDEDQEPQELDDTDAQQRAAKPSR